MGDLFFYNGTIFDGERLREADVLVRGDRIAAVLDREAGENPVPEGAQGVDCTGLVLSPGLIDLHVHFREPGFEAKETIRTGSMAAARGGFTTVCTMPNLNPVPDSPEHMQVQQDIIDRDAVIEVLPFAAITVGEKGEQLVDFEAMAGRCVGYSDDGRGVQSCEMMLEAMQHVAAQNSFISAHCEENSLLFGGAIHDGRYAKEHGIPGICSASETIPIARDVVLAERTGVRYHVCHISARESIEAVRVAKARGAKVSCEATPHNICFCEDDLQDDGRFKMNPPLRAASDRDAILEGLLDGTIECISTDHAPHTAEEKSRGLARSLNGIVGSETAFSACYTRLVAGGHMDLAALLKLMTVNPGRILGRTVRLAAGEPASLVLLDCNASYTVDPADFASMGKSSPFTGLTLTGQVAATYYLGKKVYER